MSVTYHRDEIGPSSPGCAVSRRQPATWRASCRTARLIGIARSLPVHRYHASGARASAQDIALSTRRGHGGSGGMASHRDAQDRRTWTAAGHGIRSSKVRGVSAAAARGPRARSLTGPAGPGRPSRPAGPGRQARRAAGGGRSSTRLTAGAGHSPYGQATPACGPGEGRCGTVIGTAYRPRAEGPAGHEPGLAPRRAAGATA